ncbi:Uncharacterized protein HZ326_14765 [Fusarium oxysporum f. sp. albedinis]|nr:Uncharacterized protein HZ326_14765 [Fusarium oxysporum f. sp. albedinis]
MLFDSDLSLGTKTLSFPLSSPSWSCSCPCPCPWVTGQSPNKAQRLSRKSLQPNISVVFSCVNLKFDSSITLFSSALALTVPHSSHLPSFQPHILKRSTDDTR